MNADALIALAKDLLNSVKNPKQVKVEVVKIEYRTKSYELVLSKVSSIGLRFLLSVAETEDNKHFLFKTLLEQGIMDSTKIMEKSIAKANKKD